MNYRIILALALATLMTSCSITLKKEAEAVEKPLGIVSKPAEANAGGLLYTLPQTALCFKVEARRIEKQRGEFYKYSEHYLGLKDVILEDATVWELESVSLKTKGVANPNEVFEVVLRDGSQLPLLQLTADGVLKSINMPQVTIHPKKKTTQETTEALPVPYTEDMLLANSSAKMAQEAANYIYRLRESRTAILAGEAGILPPDGESYALSLEKIDELEAQFLTLFKGTETVTKVVEYVELLPESIIEKETLFRFSAFGGVVAKDDLSGSPITIKMEGQANSSESNNLPADSAGIYYKKPAPVSIKVFKGTDVLLDKEVMMAQFGSTQTLPAHMIGDEVKIQFYPETGGLKAIK